MTDFKDRRSIRKYKRQELPAGLIDRLVKEASRAATMGGMQLYSVVVTESAAGKPALRADKRDREPGSGIHQIQVHQKRQ